MLHVRSSAAGFALAVAVLGAGEALGQLTLTSERLATGLARPVYVTHAPGDASRIFIVEQRSGTTGRVRIFDLSTNSLLSTPFLSVSGVATGNEQGLLGLAFHPDYANNGHFYVNYTASGTNATWVVRYTVSEDDPNVADPASAHTVITFAQPFTNHNGGWIGFGPDGYLYIPTGDGGSANDPGNRAQTIVNMRLGKTLRLDVDADDFPGDPNRNYAIPPDNPFVGVTGDDEIWAYGLRNPWRCSFDRATGDMWLADVGQNAWEEINFQPADSAGGENFGWRCMEGFACTGLSGCTCNHESLTLPIHAFSHAGGNCSVTGGYVYRGATMPHLRGAYFFADFCSNRIWTMRYVNGQVVGLTERAAELVPNVGSLTSISSFGEDHRGEIYVCNLNGGGVYRIKPRCAVDLDGNGEVNTVDFLAFLNAFTGGDPVADFNNDGTINTVDVVVFMNAWNSGCD
ncbi:MAG: PQQ-dependent sugar dehydrogenase [Phycisphaeraceae bacterium]|nr:PQQ-dependent sugar dehydrogenase [Phycisphaeraceae bacterium]